MLKRGMKKAMRNSAIIGEENEPARILIEPSYRKDTGRGIYYVDNAFPVFLRTSALDTARLVHSVIDEARTTVDELTREFHRVFLRIDGLTYQGWLAIDDDVSAFYGFFSMATGTHATF